MPDPLAILDLAEPIDPAPPPPPRTAAPPADDDQVPEAPPWMMDGTDWYLAERFAAHHSDRARYCRQLEAWYLWNGIIWKEDQAQEVRRLGRETLRIICQDWLRIARLADQEADTWEASPEAAALAADNKREYKLEQERRRKIARAWRREVKALQSRRKVDDFIDLAKDDERLSVDVSIFDRHPCLLACQNGVIDLRTGELRRPDPSLYLTMASPCDYAPLGQLKTERRALDLVLAHISAGDERTVSYLQLALGQSVFGHNRLEQWYIAQSEGRSGKGALFNGVQAALGKDMMPFAEAKSFIKERSYRPRDDLARIKRSRLVMVSEAERGDQLATALIKGLSGNDPFVSRQLYERLGEAAPTFTIWIQTNHFPWIDPQDTAAKERLFVVPMGKTIPRSERQPWVKESLMDPAGGARAVLAWLVEGAILSADAQRLPPPPAVVKATARFWCEADRNQDFFYERCRFAAVGSAAWDATRCQAPDMSQEYRSWADENEIPQWSRLTRETLASRLESLGCDRSKRRRWPGILGRSPERNAYYWRGVTLLTDYYSQPIGGDAITHMPRAEDSEAYLQTVYPRAVDEVIEQAFEIEQPTPPQPTAAQDFDDPCSFVQL
jgi:putative DNA primase/helicase